MHFITAILIVSFSYSNDAPKQVLLSSLKDEYRILKIKTTRKISAIPPEIAPFDEASVILKNPFYLDEPQR